MRSVGIREFRTHASRILREVEQGEEVLITKRGKVIARIVPAVRETADSEEVDESDLIWSDSGRLAEEIARSLPSDLGIELRGEAMTDL